MKTYAECKTEIARKYGYLTWSGLMEGESLFKCDTPSKHKCYNILNEEVAKLYAEQIAEDVRQRCYDNSLTFDDKGILETEIMLP